MRTALYLRRNRVPLAAALSVGALLMPFYYLNHQNPESWNSDAVFSYAQSASQSIKDFAGLQNEPRCTTQDIVHGEWREGPPLTSPEDVIETFHYQSWKWWECFPFYGQGVEDTDFNQTVKQEAALLMAAPVYVPRNGCELGIPDMYGMIRHLLRIPGGMYMSGDSLSAAWEFTINNLLIGPNSPLKFRETCKHRWIYMDTNHPDVQLYLDDAGVSIERLEFPLFSWYRSVHLLGLDELTEAFGELKDQHVLRPDICVHFDWFELMLGEIELAEAANITYAPGVVKEPYALVVDTGPHWTIERLGKTLTQEEIDATFITTALTMEKKIRMFPYEMNGYWRTASPAHMDCHSPKEFNNSVTSIIDPERPNRVVYNWLSFSFYNEVIRAITVEERPWPLVSSASRWFSSWGVGSDKKRDSRAVDVAQRDVDIDEDEMTEEDEEADIDPRLVGLAPSEEYVNPPIRVIDVWHATIKRPEAHLRPGADCLHYCSTGINDVWTHMLWRMIFEESRNANAPATKSGVKNPHGSGSRWRGSTGH